jgi:hypothetical protein
MQRETREFVEFLALELTPRNRGQLELILFYHFGLERQAEIAALLDLVLNGEAAGAGAITAEGPDRLFLDALVALVQAAPLADGHAQLRAHQRIRHIDEAWDIFHSLRDAKDWSLIRCLNFLYRTKIRPRQKIAAVTTIRNEGINLIEWIAHHRLFGIDDFIIYVNDNDDGSSDMLKLLAAHGVIHVIWNSTAIKRDGSANMFPIQAKCFGHAAEILPEARDYEWLLFSDVDEFLVTQPMLQDPPHPRPIDDLFARMEAMDPTPAAVSFNWKLFTSQAELRRRTGLNFERFTQRGGDLHVKTIARGDHCVAFHTSHLPTLLPGDIVLNDALEISRNPSFRMEPTFKYGQFNHYFSKSFEEYIGKHLRIWGEKKLVEFFNMGGNRERKPAETVPAAWIARLHEEIGRLQNLPGVAPELAKIETAFAALLADFDRRIGIEAEYHRLL